MTDLPKPLLDGIEAMKAEAYQLGWNDALASIIDALPEDARTRYLEGQDARRKRTEKAREASLKSRPVPKSALAAPAVTPEPPPDPNTARRMAEGFLKVRAELWPQAPKLETTRLIAQGNEYLQQGATEDIARAVIDRALRGLHAAGIGAPATLRAVQNPMREAIVDAGLWRGADDAAPAGADNAPDIETSKLWLAAFTTRGVWPEAQGPKPLEERCRLHPDVLLRYRKAVGAFDRDGNLILRARPPAPSIQPSGKKTAAAPARSAPVAEVVPPATAVPTNGKARAGGAENGSVAEPDPDAEVEVVEGEDGELAAGAAEPEGWPSGEAAAR